MLITLAGHSLLSAELLQWRAEEAELSIAVDGGWLAHRHAEVAPDVIVGDFDSCGDLAEIESVSLVVCSISWQIKIIPILKRH